MTQKNIYVMDIIVDKILEGKNISAALGEVYEKRDVAIPFNDDMLEVKIKSIKKSQGLNNILMRNKIKTLKEAVKFCTEYGVKELRGCGVKYGTELFERILDYYWDRMTQKEKTAFLIDTVIRNSENVRVGII